MRIKIHARDREGISILLGIENFSSNLSNHLITPPKWIAQIETEGRWVESNINVVSLFKSQIDDLIAGTFETSFLNISCWKHLSISRRRIVALMLEMMSSFPMEWARFSRPFFSTSKFIDGSSQCERRSSFFKCTHGRRIMSSMTMTRIDKNNKRNNLKSGKYKCSGREEECRISIAHVSFVLSSHLSFFFIDCTFDIDRNLFWSGKDETGKKLITSQCRI